MDEMISMSSSQSFERSLRAIKEHAAGLSKERQRLLDRIPNIGDYANVKRGAVSHHDLAYLCAATGHEFALLQGKNEDIVFHGDKHRCSFPEEISEMLRVGRLRIDAHTHPGEENPQPSAVDRLSLQKIGQKRSCVISGITGRETVFTSSAFDDILYEEIERRE